MTLDRINKGLHEDELRLALKSMSRRCRKLAELCDNALYDQAPGARIFLIAQFGYAVMLALCQVAGPELRSKFFGWLSGRWRDDNGCCHYCGKLKAELSAPMCVDCLAEVEAMDAELALEELRDMPAATDRPAGMPPDPLDARD